MAAIALDASASVGVSASALAVRVRSMAAVTACAVSVNAGEINRVKGLAVSQQVTATASVPGFTRIRDVSTMGDNSLNVEDYFGAPPTIRPERDIHQAELYFGRPVYTTTGFNDFSKVPSDGLWIRVYWTGASWDLSYYEDGLLTGLVRTFADVATPDLASIGSWSVINGGYGTPVFIPGSTNLPRPKVAASAESAIIGRDRPVTMEADAAATLTSAGLNVRNTMMASEQFARVTATGAIDRQPPLSADHPAQAETRMAQLGLDMPLSVQGLTAGVTSRACLDPGRGALGACDVVREILVLWGIESIDQAPSHARRRAMSTFNASVQEIWNKAKDRNYWTRSVLEVALASGEDSKALPDEVQNIIGPARHKASRQPLTPLGTRAELDQYSDLFLDERDTNTFPPADPLTYYIERLNQTGKDPASCTLHVRPAAGDSGATIEVDAVLEAPRFTWDDVIQCRVVPMPHRYVESLLLPVVRFHAMSHYLFIAENRAEPIATEYALARTQLDDADPLPGKSGDQTHRKDDPRT